MPIRVTPFSVNTEMRHGKAMFSSMSRDKTFAACAGLQTSNTLHSSSNAMSLLTSRVKRLFAVSSVSAVHGTAKSFRKVNLASGKMTSAEALLRWNDPRTGLVPPGRFIPILEQTGLIHEVGRWALRQAVMDYLGWRAAGLPVVRIAVNVSPLQLRDRGFIEEVRNAISLDAPVS